MTSMPIVLSYASFDGLLPSALHQYRYFLDAAEKHELKRRDLRFVFRIAQYIYSRLLLKVLLARAMRVSISILSIRTATGGQPQLYIADRLSDEVSLSISHDRNRLFVAAGLRCRCGVDVQALQGVDWQSVMCAMGWLEHVQAWLNLNLKTYSGLGLDFSAISALVWSAYEAWMKLTACTLVPSEFAWQEISLIEIDPISHFSLYEMILAKDCPYHYAKILMSLRSYEVLAVATI